MNQKHSDFITNQRALCKAGMTAIQNAVFAAQQYQLLGYADPVTGLVTDDFAGANADLTPQDIANAVSAVAAINTVLSANNNALLIALLKVGR